MRQELEKVLQFETYVLFALIFIALGSMTSTSAAVSVEVAKKCNALLAKEFPPRQVGNPAAGSTKGTAQSQRAYFKNCLAKGGKMDNEVPKDAK